MCCQGLRSRDGVRTLPFTRPFTTFATSLAGYRRHGGSLAGSKHHLGDVLGGSFKGSDRMLIYDSGLYAHVLDPIMPSEWAKGIVHTKKGAAPGLGGETSGCRHANK